MPGNTQPSDPAWLYTPIITQSSLWPSTDIGANNLIDGTIKAVSLVGMSYHSDYYFTGATDSLIAQARLLEAIIKTSADDKTGAPDAIFNLFTNDLVPAGPRVDPYDEPNRILFRRCAYLGLGIVQFGIGDSALQQNMTAQMNATWFPVRRRFKARLQEDEGIYHCVGATNPLAAGNNRQLNVLVWGAVAYRVWR